MTERREFKNEFLDFDGENLLASNGKIRTDIEKQLRTVVNRLFLKENSGLNSNDIDPGDYSVYTGASGIALLHLHMYNKMNDDTELLNKALSYIDDHLQRLSRKKASFLGGDAGPLAVGAVLYHKLGQKDESEKCIQRLLSRQKEVFEDKSMPNELLFGRVGYLYALLFIVKHIGPKTVDQSLINNVIKTVVESGKKMALSERSLSPLMYEWHEKKYLGAAHGLVGIFYMLLQACNDEPTSHYLNDVRGGIDYLLTLRFPSGNYPSSMGNSNDLLVHWCHGAPGFVHLFALAYKTFHDERYLKAAESCADILWSRGLLRKGYGLCHGVSGNAYGFLVLYRLTGNQLYLYRAVKFAEWCFDYGTRGCRVPDRPYSLFEGLAGVIYFLIDLLNPVEAKFPAFEL